MHCYVMNLVVHDITQNIPPCLNFIVLIRDMATLIRNSLKRLTFETIMPDALDNDNGLVTSHCLQLQLEFLEDPSLNEKVNSGGKALGFLLHLQKCSTFSLKLMLKFFSCMKTVNAAL